MSASNSYLSKAPYTDADTPTKKMDVVVATTQASINATMAQYLSNLNEPEVSYYYIYQENANGRGGSNVAISYEDLMKLTHNVDPFTIPDGTPLIDPRLLMLQSVKFVYAWKAKIGLPPGYDPKTTPIVQLNDDAEKVGYNLLCSEFEIASFIIEGYGLAGWLNQSQNTQYIASQLQTKAHAHSDQIQTDKDYIKQKYAHQIEVTKDAKSYEIQNYQNQIQTIKEHPKVLKVPKAVNEALQMRAAVRQISEYPYAPWVFSTTTNLTLADGRIDQLPEDQQSQARANAFSIQQLFLDLNNVALDKRPTISGLDPNSELYMELTRDFCNTYCDILKDNGQPVLGLTATQSTNEDPSQLVLSNLKYSVNPFVHDGQAVTDPTPEQEDASTLCYNGSAIGSTLPTPALFGWNWLAVQDTASYHGAISVNKKWFVDYFVAALLPYAKNNCFNVQVDTEYDWTWWGNSHYLLINMIPGQMPTISTPENGELVIQMSYNSDDDGNPDDENEGGKSRSSGHAVVRSTYELTVTFSGQTITVCQHLVVWADLTSGITHVESTGNVFDKSLTDVYTMGVDQKGKITVDITPGDIEDNSEDLSKGFGTEMISALNKNIECITDQINDFTNTSLEHIPIGSAQSFIFPGGNTFSYKDVAFSQNQDLVSHITYLNPS